MLPLSRPLPRRHDEAAASMVVDVAVGHRRAVDYLFVEQRRVTSMRRFQALEEIRRSARRNLVDLENSCTAWDLLP